MSNDGISQTGAAVSVQTHLLQVVLDDDVGDGVEDELHVLGVGGAGEVGVDLLGVLLLVHVLKLTLDINRGVLVRVFTWNREEHEHVVKNSDMLCFPSLVQYHYIDLRDSRNSLVYKPRKLFGKVLTYHLNKQLYGHASPCGC